MVAIRKMESLGLGVRFGKIASHVVETMYPYPELVISDKGDRDLEEGEDSSIMSQVKLLSVEEMYMDISEGSKLGYPFVSFTIVAAIIASIGLATNNAVMVVAAMLVSPLMGPIVGGEMG